MAHTLKLVYEKNDGTTTEIDLASGSYRMVDYIPTSGGDADTVTETAEIEVWGVDGSELIGNIEAIKRVLGWARNERRQAWVHFKPDDGALIAYRSELKSGRVAEPSSLMKGDWANKRVVVRVTWTRNNYWEVATAGNMPYGSDNANFYFFPVNDKYVGASGVRAFTAYLNPLINNIGDLPIPLGFRYKNLTGGNTITKLIVLQNLLSKPDTYDSLIEGESGAGGASYPAVADYDLYSGGKVRRIGMLSTLGQLWEKAIGTSLFPSLNGGTFMVIGAFSGGVNANLELQVRITEIGYVGPIVRMTTEPIQILDVISLPKMPSSVTFTNALLQLWGRRSDTAVNLDIDAIYVLPVDGYRVITCIGTAAIEQNNSIIDDPAMGLTYEYSAVSGASMTLSARGEINIVPGESQLLTFLPVQQFYDPDMRASLELFTRPRKITI